MWDKYPEIFDELRLVEELIKKSISSRNDLLSQAVNGLVEAGGKRLRPAFLIISCKFGKYDRAKAVSVAGALEILHSATLVHDDVIDRSGLRRGKETVYKKYGTDMAVYAGDFLYTKAVLMLSKDISIEKLDMVARTIKTICEGEVDQYRDRYNIDTTVISYIKKSSRKTALLFGAACALGAGIARCQTKIAKSLARFGFCFGMAFQIRDDLNDFLSDENISGKPVGKDLSEGIITLPVIYALNRSSAVKEALHSLFESRDIISSKDISKIERLVSESGGIKDTKILLARYIERGLEALKALPRNRYRAILMELIQKLQV